MIAADFFAGLGGFTEGAQQAGARTVFAANHWPAAIDWHAANHPDVEHVCQDLGELDKRRIPDVDLLVASPACQGFSSNGRPGRVVLGAAPKHQADRNTAWAVISACDVKRPRRVVVENVPEMAEWQLFPAWLGCLQAMGYETAVHVFQARDFGVAQDRRRLIVTAALDGRIQLRAPRRGRAATIADCLETDGHTWTDVAAKTPRLRSLMRAAAGGTDSPVLWANVDSARPRPLHDVFPTVTTKTIGQAYILAGDRCRMLTPRELARAQGFPDSYQLPAGRVLAGKLIGNAIPVPLARAVVAQVLAA